MENVKNDISLYATWELNPEFYGDFPVIEIETKYEEVPDNKQNYMSVKLNMFNCSDETYNLEDKDIGIRLRRNSTQGYEKKAISY